MNIHADKLAHHAHTQPYEAETIPIGFGIILNIAGKPITSKYAQEIRHAATTPAVRTYYRRHHGWTDQTMASMDWQALHDGQKRYTATDQQKIHKYVHELLPTGDNIKIRYNYTQPCPHCGKSENRDHLLLCTHNQAYKEEFYIHLHRTLGQKQTEPGLLRLLIDMLRGGVAEYTGTEKNKQWIINLLQQQGSIGESKLWTGFLTNIWGDIQESYLRRNHHHDKLSGTDWAKTVVSLVWRFFLETWARRNHALHAAGQSPDIIQKKLQTEIEGVHPQVPRIKFGRKYLHRLTLTELLNKPNRYLKRWLRLAKMVTDQEVVAEVRRTKFGADIKAYLPLLTEPPDTVTHNQKANKINRTGGSNQNTK